MQTSSFSYLSNAILFLYFFCYVNNLNLNSKMEIIFQTENANNLQVSRTKFRGSILCFYSCLWKVNLTFQQEEKKIISYFEKIIIIKSRSSNYRVPLKKKNENNK